MIARTTRNTDRSTVTAPRRMAAAYPTAVARDTATPMPRMVVRPWEDLADGTSTTPILTSHGLTANGSRMLARRVMPAVRYTGITTRPP